MNQLTNEMKLLKKKNQSQEDELNTKQENILNLRKQIDHLTQDYNSL